ncbi:DUF6221 family protein [Nocardia niigatensis]
MRIEEFIEARVAEDERIARESGGGEWDYDAQWDRVNTAEDSLYTLYHAEHIARHDPARVLRQCAMMRIALGWYLDDDEHVMRATIRAIAAIWSDHPDYQQEWAAG